MNDEEKVRLEAHLGDHPWTNVLPLSFEGYTMEPQIWVAAARRRLYLDVVPAEKPCPHCKKQICDRKGDHAVTCGGGGALISRHNQVRDLVKNAAKEAGFTVGI